MRKGLMVLLISVALTVPAVAVADDAGNVETIGAFAVKLTAALGSPAGNEQAAATSLRSAGVNLKADLNARLTEAEAARILSDLGMKVIAPANPSNEVSSGVATQLAAAAGLSLAASPGVELAGSDLPVYCLLEANRGKCVTCCKPALGFEPGDGMIASFCAQFCQNTEPPPPSDEEPLP